MTGRQDTELSSSIDALDKPCPESELSIYIHVPFCDKKCPYCDFYVVRDDQKRYLRWKEAIFREISLRLNKGMLSSPRDLRSIYFGGGTPSLLPPSIIVEVIEEIARVLEIDQLYAEITLEGNPGDLLCPKKVSSYLSHVNRFSIGVQSFDDSELAILGRNHDRQTALSALETLYACGVKNVSIDLINELPKNKEEKGFAQSVKRFEKTLEQVQKLIEGGRVHHLSLYNLLIQENTLFGLIKPKLPPQDIANALLKKAIEKLEQASLKRYEISAFAKEGKVSIHNSGYWRARRYIGLGPSAHSYFDGKTRSQNIASLNKYCSILLDSNLSQKQEQALNELTIMQECLTAKQRQAERLSIALRMTAGVDLQAFCNATGPLSQELSESIATLEKETLLIRRESHLRLSEKGKRLYDRACSELVII